MTRILIALFLPLTLLAQQTVNNFTVKTNLTVLGSAALTNVTINGARQRDMEVPAAEFGVFGSQVQQIPPYWNREAFTTAIGTGDFTIWSQFVTPAFTPTPQGLFRIYTPSNLARLFGVTIDSSLIMIDLMSTAATNDASAGLITSAGYWYAANPFTTPGETNELAVVRSGTNLTVYVNGVATAGTYVNQQAFGEDICETSSSRLEVGQGWKPDMLDGELWFRERVIETRLWNSEVTSAWGSTAGAIVTATQSVTTLVDESAELQTAIDWVWSNGGGTLVLPPSAVRIDNPITWRPGVNLRGSGAGPYSQDRSPPGAAKSGASILVPWYGFSGNLFNVNSSNGVTNGVPLLNNVTMSDGSYVTEYPFPCEFKDFIINGTMMENGNIFYMDMVGDWAIRDIQIFAPIGAPIYAYGCNALYIDGITGVGKFRGFYLSNTADYIVENCLWGSVRSSVFWGNVANKGSFTGNHFFNNLPQRANFATVDDATDIFTLPVHRLSTGDAIVFVENGATLPTPLDPRNVYYVYVIDGNTFKVNTQRTQGLVGGALQGVGIDITSTGTGNWRVQNGVDANFYLSTSDQVTAMANRADQSYGDAFSLNNSDAGTFIGNMVTELGWNAPTTNQASFRMWNGSDTNYFAGNIIRKRAASSQFNTGFSIETSSDGNVIDANTIDVSIGYPVSINVSGNHVSPLLYRQATGNSLFSSSVLSTAATTGFIGIPSMGGVPSGAATNANGTINHAVDFSNGRTLYNFADGWHYGMLSDVNKVLTYSQENSGDKALRISSTAANETIAVYNYGGTSAQGTGITTYRAGGTLLAPTAVGSGVNIGEYSFSSYNDATNWNFNQASIVATTSEAQTSTAAGAGLYFYTTPNGSTTTRQALRLHNEGYWIGYNFTGDPSSLVEGGMWYDTTGKRYRIRTDSASLSLIAGGSGSYDNRMIRSDGTGGSAVQSSDINVDDYTASTQPNVTLSPDNGSTADISLVMSPKGTGAFILGPKPDGSATVGGNARGSYAVDLSNSRLLATEVASGNYSLNGAFRGTASSTYSVNIGPISISSGFASLATGYGTAASGNYSTTVGTYSLSDKNGQFSSSGGRFATAGDSQASIIHVRNSTASTAATVLFTDGSSARLTLPANSLWVFTALVAGTSATGTSETYAYELKGLIRRGTTAGSTAMPTAASVSVIYESNASADCTATADTGNGALSITVTAPSATAVRWTGTVYLTQIGYP